MKMTSARVLAMVLIFAVGLATGGGLSVYWFERAHPNFDDVFLTAEAGKLEAALLSLREVRAGHIQEATEILEAKIDAALISLSIGPGKASEAAQNDKNKMIERARQYRLEFPRKTTNPGIDASVAKVLAQPESK